MDYEKQSNLILNARVKHRIVTKGLTHNYIEAPHLQRVTMFDYMQLQDKTIRRTGSLDFYAHIYRANSLGIIVDMDYYN